MVAHKATIKKSEAAEALAVAPVSARTGRARPRHEYGSDTLHEQRKHIPE